MDVFRSLQDVPPDFGPVVASIGNFDGVHRAHRWVIGQVNRRARELGCRSLVLTFDPHPVRLLRPLAPHQLLTPLAQKLDLLSETAVDAVLVLPFTHELSRVTARDFARNFLAEGLRAVEIHEGENFRFGYQANADMDGLVEYGREFGFRVRSYAPFLLRGEPVSSSRIRTLVTEGRMAHARALLGRTFAVRSTPASGRGYGTRYTVPTINLAPYPELLPAIGVYVTTLRVGAAGAGFGTAGERVGAAEGRVFRAVTNVGNRPTFGEDSFTVESHLLDFEPTDLSESTPLELTFLQRLRGEKRWPTPEALRTQIGLDVRRAQRYFALANRAAS